MSISWHSTPPSTSEEDRGRADARESQLVDLRFFAGLSVEEIAEVLGVAPITVKRDWAHARAWHFRELQKASWATRPGGIRLPTAFSSSRSSEIGTGHFGTQYDLSPDGRRVYFLDRQPAEPSREIGFILGWREVLK